MHAHQAQYRRSRDRNSQQRSRSSRKHRADHQRKVLLLSNTYVITFCSKEMYQDIMTLGGSPRKSRTIGFPDVPSELLPHFVRGVVDGDGTLSWNGDRPVLHIYSASRPFLSDL